MKSQRDTAQAAGSDPPVAGTPTTPDLDALDPFTGNERLIEAPNRGIALAMAYDTWIASRQIIAARLPAYRITESLIKLGAYEQQAALEDCAQPTPSARRARPDPAAPPGCCSLG